MQKAEALFGSGRLGQVEGTSNMAWDDPVVWILIAAIVVFFFGASRIPQFARALGEARKEFNEASKGSSSDDKDK